MNRLAPLLLLLAFLLTTPAAAQDLVLDLEGAAAWQLRNDFAVPGDEGTLVRLADDGPIPAGRATLTWHRWERWSLRIVAAPYSSDAEFVPSEPVLFEDVLFPAGEPVDVEYRFNSWRAGAFYRFAPRGDWSLRAGLTLKVRDAEIALRSGGVEASNENVGVVPFLTEAPAGSEAIAPSTSTSTARRRARGARSTSPFVASSGSPTGRRSFSARGFSTGEPTTRRSSPSRPFSTRQGESG